MKIKLLYFSSIKDKLKKSFEELKIKDNFSINDLIDILKKKYPQISQNLDNVMFAVNEEYQDKKYLLKDGDNVAVIPPVSGG